MPQMKPMNWFYITIMINTMFILMAIILLSILSWPKIKKKFKSLKGIFKKKW